MFTGLPLVHDGLDALGRSRRGRARSFGIKKIAQSEDGCGSGELGMRKVARCGLALQRASRSSLLFSSASDGSIYLGGLPPNNMP